MKAWLRPLVVCCSVGVVAAIVLGVSGCNERHPSSESAGRTESFPAAAEGPSPGDEARAMMEVNQEVLPQALAELDSMSLTLSPAGPGSETLPSLWLGVTEAPEGHEATYRATISREQAAMLVGYLAGDGLLYRSRRDMAVGVPPSEGAYYVVRVSGGQWEGVDVLSLAPVDTASEWEAMVDAGDAERQFWALCDVMGGVAAEAMDSFFGEFLDQSRASAPLGQPTVLAPSPRRAAVESLLGNLTAFEAEFEKRGTDDEHYRSLRLSVTPPAEIEQPSVLSAQLTPIQAAVLAGYLTAGPGVGRGQLSFQAYPAEAYYRVYAAGEGWHLRYDNAIVTSGSLSSPPPGVSPPTLDFLLFLRGGLIGEADAAMDDLLASIPPGQ
jgi:hypothetical protein